MIAAFFINFLFGYFVLEVMLERETCDDGEQYVRERCVGGGNSCSVGAE